MKKISCAFALFALCLFPLALAAQIGQTISGRIYDEASKVPLTGVTIVLLSADSAQGATSDSNGYYQIQGVSLGRHGLKFFYPGYEDRAANDILVTAGKEVRLDIGLSEALHQLKEVTVSYSKAKDKTRTNNDMAQVSARSFNVDETKRYAGSLGDPSRMAANFAGVVSGNDSRNDIVVRGNSPSGMLWQLEGLNIPNPNHYGSYGSTGGPISMLNNNNIDKSDFLTSAFPAAYGNAVAGVFDIKLRDGNAHKPEFLAQLGFNGFELGAEGPLGTHRKTTYLINYRYSALSAFQKLGVNFGTGAATPKYQDINYRINSNLSPKSKLIFFGIAGSSSIDFMGKDVDSTTTELYGGDPYTNERNRYSTTINGVSLEHQLNRSTFTKLTLGYATTFGQYTSDSISSVDRTVYPNAQSKFTTGKISAAWSLNFKPSAKNTINSGLTCDREGFNLVNKEMHPGVADKVFIDYSGNTFLTQGYSEWKHRFNQKITTVAGVHAQFLSVNNNIAIEPRLSVRYAVGRKQSISMGYGLHHQAQNAYTYFVQTNLPNGVAYTNKKLGFTASQHLVLTYDLNITDHMRLKAEAYYQALSRVPVEQRSSSFSELNEGSGYGLSATDSLVNKGTGHNYGTEITLERFFDKGFYFLLTTSLFESKYKGSDGVLRNTAFNTNYVFNALAGKEFKVGHRGNILAFNLKLTSVGGRNLTPIDVEQSKLQGEVVYQDPRAYSIKQSGYFRTDLKIAYRREYRKSTLELALDLQNLTNRQNVFAEYYDVRQAKVVTVYQQSFFPVPMMRYTF